MLHILWILIKFILILLGILLGVVLLGALLLLFCPVRYRGQVSKESAGLAAVQANARVTWLFGAIGAEISYKEGGAQQVIRIFGVSLDKIRSWREHWREKRKKKAFQKSRRKAATKELQVEKKQAQRTAPAKLTQPRADAGQPELPDTEKMESDAGRSARGDSKKPESSTSQSEIQHTEELKIPSGESGTFFARAWNALVKLMKKFIGVPVRLWNRIVSFIKEICQKVRKIRDTISGIQKKLDWWKAFLGDERTKTALSLVKKDAKGLIHHVLPTKVEGYVTFGCEDPAITGTALAVLGMTFPFHKNRVQVEPLFDGENQLTGNLSLKGRIYGIVLVKTALEIYINKNVKFVIDGWKHKEDESWKTKTISKKQ